MAILDTIVAEGYPGEGLSIEPATPLAVGAVYIVGLNGDVDPGRVMYGPEVYNLDTTDDMWVDRTLAGVLTAGSGRIRIPAGKSRFLPGAWGTLVAHNPSTSGGTIAWGIVYEDRGALGPFVAGGHPGHGSLAARYTVVQNDVVTKTYTVQRRLTITGYRAFSVAKNTSAAGSVLLAVSARAVSLLTSATYDLEGITNGAIATVGLTATTSRLDLEPGDVITETVTSNNVDMVEGDLATALLYTLR